jgi:hypothetical protein
MVVGLAGLRMAASKSTTPSKAPLVRIQVFRAARTVSFCGL